MSIHRRTRLGWQLGLPLAYVNGIIGCRVHHGNGGPVTPQRAVFPQFLVVSPAASVGSRTRASITSAGVSACGSPVIFVCVCSGQRVLCGGVELDRAFIQC
jgi:hypothetical protein